jgi:hypothetical protein
VKRGLSLLLSTIVLLAMSGPAASHDQGYHPWDQGESWEWRLYHAVGFCGEVNSRYVKSVKAILWAAGYIQNMDYIDQSFTNGTDTNVRDYQSFHNLGVDGCVGWNSWSNMQHGGHSNLQSTWYHLWQHVSVEGPVWVQPTCALLQRPDLRRRLRPVLVADVCPQRFERC